MQKKKKGTLSYRYVGTCKYLWYQYSIPHDVVLLNQSCKQLIDNKFVLTSTYALNDLVGSWLLGHRYLST